MNGKPLAIIGAPSSAGAFAPGQEKAPAALRDAGLIEILTAGGRDVADHGDTARFRWRPDREHPTAQNVEAVLRTACDVEEKVRHAVAQGSWPLVIGGDCTVELGTVAGHLPSAEQIGLLYFDLHPDLNVPDMGERRPGALDWMGVAHMLGEVGTVDRLSRFGPRHPLLDDHEVLFFGYGPSQATSWEQEIIKRRALKCIRDDEVSEDPEAAADRALGLLGADVDRILVHFDVDVIDFTDAPLSEHTGRNQGLRFDHAMRALKRLLASPNVAALTITELNPDHGEEGGATIRCFAEALSDALTNPSRAAT
jgi:arginase